MRAAAKILAAASLLMTASAPARAETPARVTVAESQLQMQIPPGWEEAKTPEGSLRAWRSEKGTRAVLTRVDFPNREAWRGKERFFQEVEEGVKIRVKGYQRLKRRRHRLGRVPALDLWFRRREEGAPPVVLSRFLFFRRYTVVLSVAIGREEFQRRARRRQVRELLTSFEPYFGD